MQKRLANAAARLGLNMSDVTRQALDRWLIAFEKAASR